MSYQSSIRNKKNNKSFNKTKEITYKINDEIEEYGIVVQMLGNCRCQIYSNSNIECIGTICGSLRKFNKRVLIEKGNIVIITTPSLANNKVIINYKLNNDQINNLIEQKVLNEKIQNLYKNNCSFTLDNNDIEFTSQSSEENDEKLDVEE
jgi:initiation factor 1A